MKISTRKLVQSITLSPGKVFEMLHTILLIRIEPAPYISTYIIALRRVGKRGSLAAGCLSKPIQAKANE
ncbi:unnamed protein product [Musa acuminata subsp. malaccensis]|uniref:(wild Malaysian banana) hypothetical protein n=1 Tax=Musa acuminata subsp. malaccensis TaxID=214687 RepID=A0A804IV50_MUSAM|nr:unnamed protein product [Musa acuminata subsp. malaccensis]